ncbi:Outer membrane protein beta-barrel domain-containing protein [Flavobacterium segetis]|uniref:Outer membrane protein beta-barrel domain-containing protein n=1 Tax=Flavobacterium segetis TaxID=271157 RepID=A0A1M5FBE6_9FLAO|nr:outer membrane beta-barrel protein [Flavobacterium segetis]SHF88847.1 Outer membrane protein beta-barrel domain-containing protein [Flavobacterium segetis]
MKKNLFALGFMICSLTMMGQSDTKESWYFKVGGSYFTQTAATEFPTVGGQLANRDIYVGTLGGNKLDSRESVTGSFGEGFRTGITAGYRFNQRLGVEMGVNYYTSNSKTMAQTTDRLVSYNPASSPAATYLSFTAEGQIKAFDLAPAIVLFLGESNGFEPYTKVGVIVPVYGTLDIKTNRNYSTFVGATQLANTEAYSKDVVKPNPTVGFMSALGTSYKLGKNISAFAELEYRNFTVHGKTKETTIYTENGVDKLNTPTNFRQDASYSAIHSNYVKQINGNSNSQVTNAANFDNTKADDDISSYVGISGLGLTLGLKYSL